MDDHALTIQLAAAAGVTAPKAELAALFELEPELVEWSVNDRGGAAEAAEGREGAVGDESAGRGDPRGTLRVSAWTRDRARAEKVLARLAPDYVDLRQQLVAEDYEGLGLALREGEAASVRWWSLTEDGVGMAERARECWPDRAAEMSSFLRAAGGDHTCVAVGLEASAAHQRQTLYARLADPAAAIRVLELAAVKVSQAANLFWKGLCGLEPGGRPWPKVWAGRSFGTDGGWKFYYFARGDELRRTDEVLLAAIGAGPALRRARELLHGATGQPCVQLVGLTIRDGVAPAFTAYLARR